MSVSRKEALRRYREQRYVIYALVDPRDDLPHYIGRSVDVAARFGAHRANLPREGQKRRAWLHDLASAGLAPTLRVLDVTRGVLATVSGEQRWVDFGRKLGWPLTNRPGSTRGGVWSLGQKRWGEQWSPRDFERSRSASEAA